MTWTCAAIDHGVTIYPNGKIGPCCQIDSSYLKPVSDWLRIKSNLDHVRTMSNNVEIYLTPVINILNLWFLLELLDFAQAEHIQVNPIILHGPDYLALDVIPDQHKAQALKIVKDIESRSVLDQSFVNTMKDLIENNQNQCLFQHTLSHVLLLDRLRKESLFDLLPFKNTAIETVLKNHEYE